MIMRSEKAKKRAPAGWFFFALFVAALGVVPLLGVAVRPVLESALVAEDRAEQWSPLLLEQTEDGVLLACGGRETGLLARLNAAGEVLSQKEVPGPLYWAGLRSGTLYLLQTAGEESCTLIACDPETLEETGRRALDLPPLELVFFDMDSRGTVGAVLGESRDTLLVTAAGGTLWRLDFPREITFLAAEDDVFLATAGSTLALLDSEGIRELPCVSPVMGTLSGELVLDEDGVLSRVGEDGLLPLFQCGQPLYSALSFCLDGENCPILSFPGGRVIRYDQKGAVLGSCELETAPLAVCAAGGITRKDGALRYTAFRFEEAAPSLSPSPAGTESPPAAAEGGFLLLPAGTTAAQLRELFQPEAVVIRDAAGQVFSQGRLATGMTANDRTVVVRGDCDGSGSVTQGDVRAALQLSLAGEDGEGVFFRAADLNDDGTVNGEDLLLLQKMVAQPPF